MSISTHAFATCVQINPFCDYKCDCQRSFVTPGKNDL